MKKLLLSLLLVVASVTAARAQFPVTPGLGLALPPYGYQPYNIPVNNNFSLIDTAYTNLAAQYQGTWSSSAVYNKSNIVLYMGQTYISLIAANLNNVPSTSTGQWAAIGGTGSTNGTVQSSGPWNNASYVTSSTAATVGGIPNVYTIPLNTTAAAVTAFLATSANKSVFIQQGGTPTTGGQFDNSAHHWRMHDERNTSPTYLYDLKEQSGALFDAFQTTGGGFIAGNNEIQGIDCTVFTGFVGETVMVAAPNPSGVPTSFISKISGVDSGTKDCILTSASPITTSAGWTWTVGHDDTIPISQGLAYAYANGYTLSLPGGKAMVTSTLNNDGQNIWGQGVNISQIIGPPGLDTFAAHDPSTGTGNTYKSGQVLRDFTVTVDAEIDATAPWVLCTDSAGCVNQTPLYRPWGVGGVNANYPMNRGWITGSGPYSTGALNGVANVVNGSPTICVPTGVGTPANAAGTQIIFPYQGLGNPAFSTTVLSVTGTCSGGNTVTLNSNWPGSTLTGPQYVAAQEWFAAGSTSATAIQTTISTIPSSAGRATGSVTAWSISGSNVATLTVANGYSAGQVVNLASFPTSTFFNNASVTLTSASSTQIVFPFTHATGSATETGQVLPFPMKVTLTNDITPDPQFSQANVGAWGYVELADTGEICSYFGTSNVPATPVTSPQWIRLTACALDGSAVASHAAGTQIFPLNPLNRALPWPITAALNTTVTPTGAANYPSGGVGNAGFSTPTANGVGANGNEDPAGVLWEDVNVINSPPSVPTGQNPANFQVQNDTAAIYFVGIPFKSTFRHLKLNNLYYGIVEGQPGINTYAQGVGGFPTADGNKWEDIQVQSAAFDEIIANEESGSWSDVQNFSEAAEPPNAVWPGYPVHIAGGMGDLYLDGYYLDRGTACCNPVGTGVEYTHFTTHYVEVEVESAASIYRLNFHVPARQLTCLFCTYIDWEPKDGGNPAPTYVGGNSQVFLSGVASGSPWINFGKYNSYINMIGLASGTFSNLYGVGSFLNWGVGTQMVGSAQGGTAPFLHNSVGNTRDSCLGQTEEMFFNGNIANPYACADMGLITPDEFNFSSAQEVAPMTQGWTLDPTEPVTGGFAACNIPTSGGCDTFAFDNPGRIHIGPQQRIQNNKYTVTTDFDAPSLSGSSTITFTFAIIARADVGSCSGGTVYTNTITVGNTWTNTGPLQVDLTGKQGCVLQLAYLNASTKTLVETGFINFLITPALITTQNLNVTNQLQSQGALGTAGQVWTSQGSSSPNHWATPSGGGTGPFNNIQIYDGSNPFIGFALTSGGANTAGITAGTPAHPSTFYFGNGTPGDHSANVVSGDLSSGTLEASLATFGIESANGAYSTTTQAGLYTGTGVFGSPSLVEGDFIINPGSGGAAQSGFVWAATNTSGVLTTPLMALDPTGTLDVINAVSVLGGTVFIPKGTFSPSYSPSFGGYVQYGLVGPGRDFDFINSQSTPTDPLFAWGDTGVATGSPYMTLSSAGVLTLPGLGATPGCVSADGSGNLSSNNGGPCGLWNTLLTPTNNLSLDMSSFATQFNWSGGVGSGPGFEITEGNGDTGGGILLQVDTGVGDTTNPFCAYSGSTGSPIGWCVGPDGSLFSNNTAADGLFEMSGLTSGTVTQTVNDVSGTYVFTWQAVNAVPQFLGTLTTTSGTTDTFTNAYITTSSHCSAVANNGTATLAHFSAYSSGSAVLTHAATSGMGYDVWCAAD